MKHSANIVYHILFWIIFMFSFAIAEWAPNYSLQKAFLFEVLLFPTRLIAVYLNWYLLIPNYLYQGKFLRYGLFLFVIFLILGIIHRIFTLYWAFPFFFPEWMIDVNMHIFNVPRLILNTLMIAFPVAITTGWRLFINWNKKQIESKELEIEKKETELKYLRSQINPHFLFNTLNNIYGLSLEQSKKVPNLILGLSEFLSFSLYETNQNQIPIQKEIDLILNFIELQTARFEDRIDVHIAIQENIYATIPPMLLISFVENAFKHSLKNETEKAKISIALAEINGLLTFKVENSKPVGSGSSSGYNGIGLKNINRRLELLYEENYKLDINDEDAIFKIVLQLNLNNND